jgi:hypothetical protein
MYEQKWGPELVETWRASRASPLKPKLTLLLMYEQTSPAPAVYIVAYFK